MSSAESAAKRAYRDASTPAEATPWREVVFTVLDFETTGFEPATDEIISFATVTVERGRVRLDDARYELVRPGRMPGPDNVRIHGLREQDLSDAPPLSERIDELLQSLTGRALVAHVAPFERRFLNGALSPLGLELRNPMVDTAALGRELLRLRREPAEPDPIGLEDLARVLSLPVHRRHHADGDALTTAQAFIALATHLESFENPLTLGALVRMSDERGARRRAGPIRRLLRRFSR
jgi:DNA polymerase-3 subunit epsilon